MTGEREEPVERETGAGQLPGQERVGWAQDRSPGHCADRAASSDRNGELAEPWTGRLMRQGAPFGAHTEDGCPAWKGGGLDRGRFPEAGWEPQGGPSRSRHRW